MTLFTHVMVSRCYHSGCCHNNIKLRDGYFCILNVYLCLIDSNDDGNYERGGWPFTRPYGWRKKALRVLGRFDDDNWLGASGSVSREESVYKEWPVSYHGTSSNVVESIVENGYDLSKGHRFAFGVGIYSTPMPKVAEEQYSKKFYHKGCYYKMIFMNRVHPSCTTKHNTKCGIYFVTAEDRHIRPYAILFKKV